MTTSNQAGYVMHTINEVKLVVVCVKCWATFEDSKFMGFLVFFNIF